jgi:phage protein U
VVLSPTPVHPIVQKAQGYQWLFEWLNGMPTRKIARKYHKAPSTITKYMRKAAAQMVDKAQEKLMEEVFPLAIDVLKTHLQQQLDLAEQGQPVDLSMVEKVLNGMYVMNSPQLKGAFLNEGQPSQVEPQSLEGFIAFRQPNLPVPHPATPPVLDMGKVEDVDNPHDVKEVVQDDGQADSY